ncbi:MAG: NADPH:quinone oxidoreductase family protein [Candidatus Binatia bacterium]
MHAVICKQHGPPENLVFEEIEQVPLEAGQVRVAVHACGVNFPDTLIIQDKYQFKPALPFSPGGEVAGIVREVASDVDGFKEGDRVIAVLVFGGYADEVVTEATNLMPMPDGMDFVTAAGFTMTYGTSIHALNDRARLQAGENLLVLGAAGGVGLAAVEIGKALGARVIAAASDPDKLLVCQEHGADELIDYSKEDLKQRTKELTGGAGADVAATRCINWKGRLLVVGFASGRIPQLPVNLTLLKGCQVVGVFWGAFTRYEPEANARNLRQLAEWFAAGIIKPHVCASYPLSRAAEAMNLMLKRRVRGKVVLTTDNLAA